MEQATISDEKKGDLNELSTLENLIQAEPPLVKDARTVLRRILWSEASPNNETDGTIGDALAVLAKHPSNYALPAIVLLRCLAIPDIVPEPNSTNQIVRLTVELCEAALPEIIDFLRIKKGDQNYQKFEVLKRCHERIEQILSPLRSAYGDLGSLLSARKDIIGCLNHSIVKKYAEPFRLTEVRTTIESIFSKLNRVSVQEPTLLSDIEECHRIIRSSIAECDASGSFLACDFLTVFLNTCEGALAEFIESLRGRFSAAIIWGGAPNYELQKRYPLHEPSREIQIVYPLRNPGPGMATDVRVSVHPSGEEVAMGGETIMLGNVLPGDFSVTFDAMVIASCSNCQQLLSLEWGEIGNPVRKSELFECRINAQSSAVDWQSLEYQTPYSTDVAEGDKFLGRADKVRPLAARLLRQPMESFYITGQKRVGKTSLALAAAEFAKANDPSNHLDYEYILWGSVAHADPNESLHQLGQKIEGLIAGCLPQGVRSSAGDYHGSLSGLVRVSEAALKVQPDRRFVIILDEFDEIHQELFLQGNLAETFFGNLRALSRCKNVCMVLVGGENMPFIMDRQGQKLNNFSRINLSYFSRESEWSDFQLLVRAPTKGTLNWHEDAVSEIFNITNGNPYFAKIVCAGVFRSAVSGRDADITASEVKRATEAEVSLLGTNSFAHLWQDGVPKAISEREPDILRRMRVLVAMARCIRHGVAPTAASIVNYRSLNSLSEAEVTAVLHDFARREVLREDGEQYNFGLPIFRLWLVDVGVSQLVADALNEELANAALAQENVALIRSEEVVSLSREWPTYRGRRIGTDDVRAWYQQVESFRDQRILFELLKRTRVFSEDYIRERLKTAHAMIRHTLPEFVRRARRDRRKDVLLTYVDGEGKSGASYASLYAETNGILAECVVAPGDFRSRFNNHVSKFGSVAALVIIDDIAATGRSLSQNIKDFCLTYKDLVQTIAVKVITLVATKTSQSELLDAIRAMEGMDIEFRSCEILPDDAYAFPEGISVWKSQEDEARAKALCTDLGSRIYKQSPLGYGGMGLLVVFPNTVPNNSLPILHSHARSSSGRTWTPLFPRVVN